MFPAEAREPIEYPGLVPHAARSELLLIALLGACAPAPPATAACLTRSDCRGGEECIFGRCTASEDDAAAVPDSGTPTDGNVTMDSGLPLDAGSTDAGSVDAFASDAPPTDAASPDAAIGDAATSIDAASVLDAGPVPGESCASPIPVTLVAGRAHLTGRLADYRPDHGTFCGEDTGRDVVYVVEVGSGIHDIDVVSGPATLDTVVGISGDCDTFWDCEDDRSGADHGARLILHRWPGPRAYFVVKGYDATVVGDYTFDVTVTDAAAGGTTCASPIDLTGGGKVIAWTPNATSPLAASCAPTGPLIDAYRLGPEADGTIGEISAYFGDDARSVAVVQTCSATPGETWCAASTMPSSSAWEVFQRDVPAVATAQQFIAILGGPVPGSNAYSLDVSP
jgi:hypothetical protein